MIVTDPLGRPLPDNLPVLTEVVESQAPLPSLHEAAGAAMDDDFGVALDLPPALMADIPSALLPVDTPGSALFETLPSLDLGSTGLQEAEEEGTLFSELDTPDNWPPSTLAAKPADSLLQDFEFETSSMGFAPEMDHTVSAPISAAFDSPSDLDAPLYISAPRIAASWETDVPDLELADLSLELDALFPAAAQPARQNAESTGFEPLGEPLGQGGESTGELLPALEPLALPAADTEEQSPMQSPAFAALPVPDSAQMASFDMQGASTDTLSVASSDVLMQDVPGLAPDPEMCPVAAAYVPDAEMQASAPVASVPAPAFLDALPETVAAESVLPLQPTDPLPVSHDTIRTVAVVDEAALLDAVCQRIMPRMKVELTLWLQDAIEVQSKQMLAGVMQQMKEDYDMLFGESLRESVRQAIADIGRNEQHKD
jgi:hypothetical protein